MLAVIDNIVSSLVSYNNKFIFAIILHSPTISYLRYIAMEMLQIVILLSWLINWLLSCICRRQSENIQLLHRRNGEPIAVDYLIQKYEREFQKFHDAETRDGDYLEWPVLENINLSNYCKKYLEHSVPRRKADNVTGVLIKNILNYEKENTRINSKTVILKCRIMYKRHKLTYYVTRAPELSCVYSLKYTGIGLNSIFTVINKHCDFEDKSSLKRKRLEIVDKRHKETGQPIAKDEYLLEYELEHQIMIKKEGLQGKLILWPYAVLHHNIDSYCYHYMAACVPTRNQKNIKGSWKVAKLHYMKLNTKRDVEVTTVVCWRHNVHKRHHYMTRALETNCVYALRRKGHLLLDPLIIIFKHCDFEESNYKQTTSQNNDVFEKNTIPKSELKEETFDTLKTLELYTKE